MKFVLLAAVLFLGQAAIFARDSAYEALRAYGAQRGQEQLNHVIEVQGRDGTPQPNSWKILLDDPDARGGVREVEMKKGAVASEKTPVRGYGGTGESAVMNFQKLNLDSEGAFVIANREATKAQLGFDKIDYTLRMGDETTTPVWILRMIDSRGKMVGTVHLAADTGSVLRREGMDGKDRLTDEDYIPEERVVVRERTSDRGRDYGYEDESGESDDHHGVKYHIKKAFVGAGASLEEFVTGKRTLDRNYREE